MDGEMAVTMQLSSQQGRLLSVTGVQPRTWIDIGLRGSLDRSRLQLAIADVLKQHEILRAQFTRTSDGILHASVLDSADALLWKEHEGEADFDCRVQQMLSAIQPDAPAKAFVLLGKEDEHRLVVSVPALAADRWSLEALTKEIARNYSELPCTHDDGVQAMQYAAYTMWQQEILANKEEQAGLEFWQHQEFRIFSEPSWLSNRDLHQDIDPGRARLTWTMNVDIDALDAVVMDLHTSERAFLLSSWLALLQRLTGQPTVAIGLETDGRCYEELQSALGLFSRYIPVGCHFDGRDRFDRVLADVEVFVGEAERWQEHFSWSTFSFNGACSQTFFPIVFGYRRATEAASSQGVEFSVVQSHAYVDRFTLGLSIARADRSLIAEIDYDAAKLSPQDVARLSGYVEETIAEAITQPNGKVGGASLLSPSELKEILVDYNATSGLRHSGQFVHDAIAEIAHKMPESVAIRCGHQLTTFDQLEAAADRLAAYLHNLGVGPDTPVGVCLPHSERLIVALLGVLKAGGAYVPIDSTYPSDRVALIVNDARLRWVICDECQRPLFDGTDTTLLFPDPPARTTKKIRPPLCGSNLAYIMYTSGSTGRPKGVMVSHDGLWNYVAWCIEAYNAADGSGAPLHSSISFDLTVTTLFVPLVAGRTIFMAEEGRRGVDALQALLQQTNDYSFVKLTPGHLRLLAAQGPSLSLRANVRSFIVGGEALTSEELDVRDQVAPQGVVHNEYGPTETVVGCCVQAVRPGTQWNGAVPIGRPIAGTSLYVLDGRLQPVPSGVAGELYIAGAGLARGYQDDPTLTAEKFLPDPFSEAPGARMYRSGDRVRHRGDGTIEYLGRLDRQVKIRGFRVEPGEVEDALLQHPAVAQALVKLVDEKQPAKKLAAYVVPKKQHPMAGALDAELLAFLRRSLPDHMVPSALVSVTAFPLTPNGKVDQAALPRPEYGPSEGGATPRTMEEEVLAGVWCRVLELTEVGLDDNYFAVGGDSIRSIQIVAEARERGLNLTIQQVFENPTLRQLARACKPVENEARLTTRPYGLVAEQDRKRMPEGISDAYPLTQLQQGMIYHRTLNPRSAIYHDISSVHVRAPLDVAAIEACLERILQRHPVLRTTFDLVSFSEPLQLVHDKSACSLGVDDLTHVSSDAQELALQRWMDEEKRRGFDSSRLPLVRFHIHIRSSSTFQFSLSFHHAILDGWSEATLLTELFHDYLARLENRPVEIEGATASFGEFVALERAATTSVDCRDYWLNTLRDARFCRLPHWRNPARTHGALNTSVNAVPISDEIARALKRLALDAAVPIKSVLLAAHLRVLNALTGERDVLTCVVSSGRPEIPGGDRAVGLFINSLPFRLLLKGGSWLDLVNATFDAERKMLPFRRYPMAEMKRLVGGQTISESLFYFTHYHLYESVRGFESAEIIEYMIYEQVSFPLASNFSLDPFTGAIHLNLKYDNTMLSEEQVSLIGGYYLRVLSAMSENHSARYENLCVLSDEERRRIIVEWNATATPFDTTLLPARIAAFAASAPNSTALIGDEAVSYGELERRANRLARRLIALGVGPEVVVGFEASRSVSMVVAALAILKAGGAYLALDPTYPVARLAHMMEDAGASIVIATDKRLAASSGLKAVLVGTYEDLSDFSELPIACTAAPENLAYVMYTSGSSGEPKGVMITHRSLANLFTAMDARIALGVDSAFAATTSMSFDISVLEIFWTLVRGAKVILPDRAGSRFIGPQLLIDLWRK